MTTTKVTLKEEDLIRVMLDFLSSRNYFVAMRTLEKESGVVNCDYSDDVLFLRELVLDGDWDEVLTFAEPLQNMHEFELKRFHYFVLKQKFLEFLSMKSHIVDKGSSNNSIEEVLKTLQALQENCSSKEEYSNLCWLLTVPNLKDRPEFSGWTLDNSRMNCFHNILELVSQVLPSKAAVDPSKTVSKHGRLLQLITKGILYESCTSFCQSAATGNLIDIPCDLNVNVAYGPDDHFSANLLSWIRTLDMDAFIRPFEQLPLSVILEPSYRPHGVTQSLDTPQPDKKSNVKLMTNSLTDMMTEKDKNVDVNCIPATISSKSSHKIPNQKMQVKSRKAIHQDINAINVAQRTSVETTPKPSSSNPEKKSPAKSIRQSHVTPDEPDLVNHSVMASQSLQEITDNQRMDVSKVLEAHEERRRKIQEELRDEKQSPRPVTKTSREEQRTMSVSASTKSKDISADIEQTNRHSSHRNESTVSVKAVSSKVSQERLTAKPTSIPDKVPRPTPSAMYKERVGPAAADISDGSGRLSTSTPKTERHRSSITNPVHESAVLVTSNHQQDDDIVASQITQNVQQNKENNSDDPSIALGPKINGVRIPLAKTTVTTNRHDNVPSDATIEDKQNDEKFTENKEDKLETDEAGRVADNIVARPLPSSGSTVKTPGPKIKTKDGSKVLVSDLLKSREEIKNASATSTTHASPHHRSSKHDARHQFKPLSRLTDIQAIRAVSFHPSGQMIAVGSNTKTLRICRFEDHPVASAESSTPEMEILHQRPKYHRGSIYCCAWSPRGDLLATGSNDKVIKLLPFDSVQSLPNAFDVDLTIHSGTVRELAFVPGRAAMLVSGGVGDGSLPVTDCQTSQNVGYLRGHSGNVLTVFAAEGDLVATGSTDNTIRMWDLRSGRCIDVIMVGESSPATVALNGSGSLLAAGQEDGCILLYDVNAGRTLHSFRLHQEDCRSVRFSPDSRLLLTGSYDSTVNLLHCDGNLDRHAPVHYPVGYHTNKVIQCRWHPERSVFVTSSADKTTQVWYAS